MEIRKPASLIFLFLFSILYMLLSLSSAQAATHYVRAGATGTGTGSDWINAYPKLPSTLIRGDVYYFSEGNYGAVGFNAPAGTQIIAIKKATPSDHGSSTGWSDSMGDGPANFTNWYIATNYLSIDGVTGSKYSDYGFVIHDGTTGGTAIQVANVSNISISKVDASTTVTTCDTTTNLTSVIYAVSGGTNLVVRNSYIHESNSWAMMGINGWNSVTLENNYFRNACRKELLSARNDSNIIFRNNIAENSAGTGIIVMENPRLVQIYNNIFFTSAASKYSTTDCLICNWYGSGMNATDVNIVGNTFYNLQPQTLIGFDNGTNIKVTNNIFHGSYGISFYGNLTHDYNSCYSSSSSSCNSVLSEPNGQLGIYSMFVDPNDGNFNLTSPTDAGETLLPPYNLDRYGNVRGADGIWDRGAVEFDRASPQPSPSPAPSPKPSSISSPSPSPAPSSLPSSAPAPSPSPAPVPAPAPTSNSGSASCIQTKTNQVNASMGLIWALPIVGLMRRRKLKRSKHEDTKI